MGEEIKEVPTIYWHELYVGDDEIAKKLKMTKKQYEFVQKYMVLGNATQAIKETEWWGDRFQAHRMKNNTRINMYIQETAQECAEIQFEQIIKNPKAPMAVRNDAIKDRLNRAWVGVKDDDDKPNMFVGNMTITIEQ